MEKSRRRASGVWILLLLLGTVGWGCEGGARGGEGQDPVVEVVVGDLVPRGTLQRARLREGDGIIDGDTIRAVGFDQSIRLLCIDTEETLEGDDLAKAQRDWEAYRRGQREEGAGPASYGTFLGNEATAFAERFFEGVEEIFLEYQSPEQTRGFFGRHLAYAWVKGPQGEWKNYNVEAVRAGMTPYFTSYGWCDAYHAHFVAAEEEARKAGRGIWAPGARSYDDYEERRSLWEARAREIGMFREYFGPQEGVVKLGTDTAMARLRLSVGQRVMIFGALDRHAPRARPPKLHFHHRFREDFVVVTAAGSSFEEFGVEFSPGHHYYVEGVVELYRGNPQLRVDGKSFIRSGATPPPRSR